MSTDALERKMIFQPKPPRFWGSKAVKNFQGLVYRYTYNFNIQCSYKAILEFNMLVLRRFFSHSHSHAAISPLVLLPPSSSRGIWACPDWRNCNIGFNHINLRCPFCWSRIVKQLFYCCGGCFVCGKGVVWILFLWNFH